MDDKIKKNIKKVVENTETGLARYILRWKYKKEGKPVPTNSRLEDESRYVADQAHSVIATRGKNVWNELKRVYIKGDKKKGDSS